MAIANIHTYVLRQIPREVAGHPDAYQVVREVLQGNDEIIHEGSFYECRSALERHYQRLINNSRHFSVYWRDEFSLLVYDHSSEHGCVVVQPELQK